MTAVYILLTIAAIIIVLSFVKIKFTADFAYKSENNELYIKFLFIKVRLYPNVKKDIDKGAADAEEIEENTDEKKSEIFNKLANAKYVYSLLKKDILKLLNYIFEKAISIDELNISAKIGTGEAMYTGIVYGAVNAAVFGFLGAADRKMKIKNHHTDIKADFDNAVLSAGVYAVVYTRAVHLYYLAVKALIIYWNLKRTFEKKGKMNNE